MNKKLKGCMLHNTDHWATPKKIYEHYMKLGYKDPCPLHCETFNGLEIEWNENMFINPPYSQIEKWVDKAINEREKYRKCHYVFLLPVRTDTKWFNKLSKITTRIRFIKGRLHFNESKEGAPFPSMLVDCYFESNLIIYSEIIDIKKWD